MDPFTSCVLPGCRDPYLDSDSTLTWTFQDSDRDRNPPFVQRARSFAPACYPNGDDRCSGLVFNTYTGEGLSFSRVNMARYAADPGPFALDPDTPFVNILVTDGETSPDSLGPEPLLADMLANGAPTHVIGFGAPADLDADQLAAYARAGGTRQAITVDPAQGDSANALSNRIAEIIGGLAIDPCCQLNDCSEQPEPSLPLCGNGTVDRGETCDEGAQNGALRGACNAACTATAYCGDGQVSGAEICDDTNRNDSDACRNDCSGTCGDGITSGPEQCDDENDDETDGCRSDCTRDRDYPSGSGGANGGGGSGAGANGAGANGAGANGAGANGAGANGAGANGAGPNGAGASSSGSGVNGSSGSTGSGTNGLGVDGGVDGGDGSGVRQLAGDTGGCGCRVPGRPLGSGAPRAPWSLALLGLWITVRRRRSRDFDRAE
jgi:cysteine-rich repeat protein